jgi:hypothetical protein
VAKAVECDVGMLVAGRAAHRQERRKRICFRRVIGMRNYFLGFGIILTLPLAACSWQGVTPPSGETGAFSSVAYPAANGGRYKVLYDFPGGAGGKSPGGGLAFINGVMFGTTGAGGDASGCNCGTVFAGTKVIYSFKGTPSGDGEFSTGTLLPVGDKLYGATIAGGLNGFGLRNKGPDGLVFDDSTKALYGETPGGGLYQAGTIFQYRP